MNGESAPSGVPPTLAGFLAARLDEDEAAARAALPFRSEPYSDWECINAQIIRWVAAGRAILALYEAAREFNEESLAVATLQTVIFILAAVYSDHADYRDEWNP